MNWPTITYVYFDKEGIPYNGNVQYTVTCYGYTTGIPPTTLAPGSYQPQPAFRYSASCTGYGCPVYEPYYLMYRHIDWCSLEGVTDNTNFTIQNFSTRPFSRCDMMSDRVARDFGGRKSYFYPTPEYVSCRYFEQKTTKQWTADSYNFSKENVADKMTTILQLPGRNLLYRNFPRHGVTINRSDINMNLVDYIAYLETCDVNSDPACPGWLVDGKPLKSFPEYRTLKKNATYLKDHPCDTFLVEADPSLILPFTDYSPWPNPCDGPCNLTERICESRFTIPSVSNPDSNGIGTTFIRSTPNGKTEVHRSPVESLYCTVLSWFKISCQET